MPMRSLLKKTSYLAVSAVLISALFPCRCQAATTRPLEDPVFSAYRQLVTENKDCADLISEVDLMENRTDFETRLFSMDYPDNLYDGMALYARGQWMISKIGDTAYQLTTKEGTAASVEELEELTDRMLDEIHETYDDEDASQRVKFYDIVLYLTDTFDYDHQTAANDLQDQDQVSAYYGDRLITCRGFSYLLYLLCNKSGIDCRMILGASHIYNMVRFNDKDEYFGVDLSNDDPHGYLGYADMYILKDPSHHPELNGDADEREFDMRMNEGLSYSPAGFFEYAKQSFYYLGKKGPVWELKTNWNFYLLIFALTVYVLVFVKALRRKRLRRKKKRRQADPHQDFS